jgi:hypothetical protein
MTFEPRCFHSAPRCTFRKASIIYPSCQILTDSGGAIVYEIPERHTYFLFLNNDLKKKNEAVLAMNRVTAICRTSGIHVQTSAFKSKRRNLPFAFNVRCILDSERPRH